MLMVRRLNNKARTLDYKTVKIDEKKILDNKTMTLDDVVLVVECFIFLLFKLLIYSFYHPCLGQEPLPLFSRSIFQVFTAFPWTGLSEYSSLIIETIHTLIPSYPLEENILHIIWYLSVLASLQEMTEVEKGRQPSPSRLRTEAHSMHVSQVHLHALAAHRAVWHCILNYNSLVICPSFR